MCLTPIWSIATAAIQGSAGGQAKSKAAPLMNSTALPAWVAK